MTSLLLSALRGNGQQRYEAAVEDFARELKARGVEFQSVPLEELDWLLAEKVVELWEDGQETTMNLARAGLLVAAVSKMRPHQKFRVAWMAFAAAVMCLTEFGQPEAATAILLCFCGLMRASEALQLLNKEVLDCGNALVLIIGVAKKGLEQKVILSHPTVLQFVRNYKATLTSRDAEHRFLPISCNKLQRWLQKALDALGFPGRWTSHGLRRGGATELLRRGVPLPEIALMGRWQSERSMRE